MKYIPKNLELLILLLFITANLPLLKVGPVSASFFVGFVVISIVFTRMPKYVVLKKDIRPLAILVVLSLLSLFFSPISFDSTSLFTSIQLVYWLLIANLFANICPVIKWKSFVKSVILTLIVIGVIFVYKRGDDGLLSENESSFIVVFLWPFGLFLSKHFKRFVYIVFVVGLLYLIGSRTGILLLLIQLVSFYILKKIETKGIVKLLGIFFIVFLLISNSNVRLYIAEKIFPNDQGMQMVIENPEIAMQMDKSWVQRRIQQEKCKQVAEMHPFFGIGPLNLIRYNINIDVSKIDVDDRILNNQYDRSYQRSSHNAYFQLLAENGFIGLSIVVFFMLRLLLKFYSMKEIDESYIIITISLIGMIINLFMVSGLWGTNTWLMVGLYCGFIGNK